MENSAFKCFGRTGVLSAIYLGLMTSLVACSQNDEKVETDRALVANSEVSSNQINPENWPELSSEVKSDPAVENRAYSLLELMSLEEKVGQIIQAEIRYLKPEDVKTYHLGSVLNGGGAFPNNNKNAAREEWVALADEFYAYSMDTSDGGQAIPVLWGSDAVHGHNNVKGAIIYPHNIGLGAANNPELIFNIAEATAKEVASTGLDWTFAPTLAVVRNDRWGRTYESYSEHPEIVARYAQKVVHGIQGVYGTESFMDARHLLANAKHYVGDGGTLNGIDQGDTISSEAELRDIHSPGYFSAIEAGVQIVMTSFSSWNGEKMHGHKELLTDVLKQRMGFDGFVISDWNAHAQVPGCDLTQCAAAINAGIDMIMVPEHWREFYANTLQQVKDGEISISRLNDAVLRILRVKIRAGLLDQVKPSMREWVIEGDGLGSPKHREVARQAVRESLVLLKNNNNILPLRADAKVLLVGNGANNIGKQSGGWTLSWQGTGNANSDFPNGDSIYAGFVEALEAGGGSVELSENGTYTDEPDVVVAVYGEDPYAEFQGDRESLYYRPGDTVELDLLKEFKQKNIPVVSVFLSGRPMWVNPYINVSEAFVAAWLPGSEGKGVADVIVGDSAGKAQFDVRGRLSFSWPKTADQTMVNYKDENYDPLFAYGYGLSYGDSINMDLLSEESGLDASALKPKTIFMQEALLIEPWTLHLSNAVETKPYEGLDTKLADSSIRALLVDRNRQGDSYQFIWSGTSKASVIINSEDGALNLQRESAGGLALGLELKVNSMPTEKVVVSMSCGENCSANLDASDAIKNLPLGEWQQLNLSLACFAEAGLNPESVNAVLGMTTEGEMDVSVTNVRVVTTADGPALCLKPE